MLRFSAAGVAASIGITFSCLFSGTPASLAHEHRAVGNYEVVVGWQNEPALAYKPNGLHLGVTFFPNGVPEEESEEAEAEGQPVEGLEETLEAEIIAGGGAQTKALTLEPAFGEEGPMSHRWCQQSPATTLSESLARSTDSKSTRLHLRPGNIQRDRRSVRDSIPRTAGGSDNRRKYDWW